jgi:hypothetical protein
MTNKITFLILALAFSFIAGMLTTCSHFKSLEPESTVRIDTVWLTKSAPKREIQLPQANVKSVPRLEVIESIKRVTDTVYVPQSELVKVFEYDSLIYLDSLQINYAIRSLGLVTSVEFGYKYNYPSVSKTETVVIRPSGIYAGMFANKYTAGVQGVYVRPKWLVGVGYGADQSYNVNMAIKLGK